MQRNENEFELELLQHRGANFIDVEILKRDFKYDDELFELINRLARIIWIERLKSFGLIIGSGLYLTGIPAAFAYSMKRFLSLPSLVSPNYLQIYSQSLFHSYSRSCGEYYPLQNVCDYTAYMNTTNWHCGALFQTIFDSAMSIVPDCVNHEKLLELVKQNCSYKLIEKVTNTANQFCKSNLSSNCVDILQSEYIYNNSFPATNYSCRSLYGDTYTFRYSIHRGIYECFVVATKSCDYKHRWENSSYSWWNEKRFLIAGGLVASLLILLGLYAYLFIIRDRIYRPKNKVKDLSAEDRELLHSDRRLPVEVYEENSLKEAYALCVNKQREIQDNKRLVSDLRWTLFSAKYKKEESSLQSFLLKDEGFDVTPKILRYAGLWDRSDKVSVMPKKDAKSACMRRCI